VFCLKHEMNCHNLQNFIFEGRNSALAASRLPLNAKSRVRSITCQSMWQLWWTKSHWDRLPPSAQILPRPQRTANTASCYQSDKERIFRAFKGRIVLSEIEGNGIQFIFSFQVQRNSIVQQELQQLYFTEQTSYMFRLMPVAIIRLMTETLKRNVYRYIGGWRSRTLGRQCYTLNI
jgi:hypothetical protein